MHRLSSALLAASLFGPAANSDTVPGEDRAAIESAIQHYFHANDTADPDELVLAFHPVSIMYGNRNGAFVGVDQPEWQARLRKERAEGKPPNKATWRKILSVDISGDVASAKLQSDFPTFQFLDYVNLVKIDGTWRIVNKVYYRKPK